MCRVCMYQFLIIAYLFTLLWAEFVMCRVCYGPSLLCAELTRQRERYSGERLGRYFSNKENVLRQKMDRNDPKTEVTQGRNDPLLRPNLPTPENWPKRPGFAGSAYRYSGPTVISLSTEILSVGVHIQRPVYRNWRWSNGGWQDTSLIGTEIPSVSEPQLAKPEKSTGKWLPSAKKVFYYHLREE